MYFNLSEILNAGLVIGYFNIVVSMLLLKKWFIPPLRLTLGKGIFYTNVIYRETYC